LRSEITFDSFSASNSIGTGHAENQDSYLVDKENLLVAVADGVGGYSGAKEASSLAIELLEEHAPRILDENSLATIVNEIHLKIASKSRALRFRNMGTTLAVAKIFPDHESVLIGNVGDSPILLFRNDSVESVYEDDSHRSSDPFSMYGIIQYLGLECKLDVHVRRLQCAPKDVLLLCSDGITDNLLNYGGSKKLASVVKTKSARKVVENALETGLKPDDMTAVLVFFS
jgi:PPM family protein phosphatase